MLRKAFSKEGQHMIAGNFGAVVMKEGMAHISFVDGAKSDPWESMRQELISLGIDPAVIGKSDVRSNTTSGGSATVPANILSETLTLNASMAGITKSKLEERLLSRSTYHGDHEIGGKEAVVSVDLRNDGAEIRFNCGIGNRVNTSYLLDVLSESNAKASEDDITITRVAPGGNTFIKVDAHDLLTALGIDSDSLHVDAAKRSGGSGLPPKP